MYFVYFTNFLFVHSEEDEEEEEEEEEFDEEAYLEAQRKALEEEQLMEAVSVLGPSSS